MQTVASFELMLNAGELFVSSCIHAAALLLQPAAELKQKESENQQNGSTIQDQVLEEL